MMMMTTTTVSDTATVTTNPYGAYSPGDTGNWDNIGPWFATVIFAVILTPYAFKTLVSIIQKYVMRHV